MVHALEAGARRFERRDFSRAYRGCDLSERQRQDSLIRAACDGEARERRREAGGLIVEVSFLRDPRGRVAYALHVRCELGRTLRVELHVMPLRRFQRNEIRLYPGCHRLPLLGADVGVAHDLAPLVVIGPS